MKFHIITLFPDSFSSFFKTSIVGRAKKEKLFGVVLYDLGDYSQNTFRRADDKAYGMHGQVLSPEPIAKCLDSIFLKLGRKIPVVFLTPAGKILTQKKVEKFVEKIPESIIICGHYEGIDQRIRDLYVDLEVSIGKYVLTSGELAAQVFIDALIRHIPGALGNVTSLEEESFSVKLSRKKEYPVYTRPRVFMGKEVPDVLVSGNHKEIEKWKKNNLQ